MINNLKSIRGDRFGGKKALDCLALAKEITGKSERDLLVSMVLYAFENDPRYLETKALVITETVNEERAKKCLTVLRKMQGISEQSLLASMVQYSFANNPDYTKPAATEK